MIIITKEMIKDSMFSKFSFGNSLWVFPNLPKIEFNPSRRDTK